MTPRPPYHRKSLLLRAAGILVRCIYRISVTGLENLPDGGLLLLPNHVTWVDAIVLQTACPRPIRFVIFDEIYRLPWLNPLFRLLKAIPISTRHAKDAVREAAERIRAGEIVCIFPEGELSRSGILLKLKRGYELIARTANAPVVPVWLDQLWGSIFSFYGGKFFKKIPRQIPYPVMVAFGEPLRGERADIANVRQKMLEMGNECYEKRPILEGDLGEASLRGLKHRQFDTAIIDGADGSRTSRGMVLAAALALRRYIQSHCAGRRIGVLLPPGRGGVIANLAIALAGKVPVNLNFTAGTAAMQAALRIAEIQNVITAGPVLKRLPDLPLPANVIHLEKVIPGLKRRIAFERALVLLLPWRMLARLAGVPGHGGHEEATILFTSGSSGEPKGAVLSHRNLLGNVSQFSAMLSLTKDDAVLASLPFFHSFGCTVTLWYPLIEGVRMVTYPSPLETAKNAELIERHRITLVVATPTFLRAYLRKARKEQLASVDLLVTGAEKLPADLAEAFEKQFGKKVMQGYGLTETSPVTSVNLPEPKPGRAGEPVQPSSRDGSVGRMAAGMAARICDPDTDEMLSLHSTGMLWLKGPNIFEGYLNDPVRTAAVLQDGWLKTGDLGRFDEDGFLYIEGRVSRFSKIGGEMVPHETVEGKISEVLGLADEAERSLAVVGIPDPAKGEALVILSAIDIDLAALRTKLAGEGISNLWIPRVVRRVDRIPVLGSGKLDLKGCKELATGP